MADSQASSQGNSEDTEEIRLVVAPVAVADSSGANDGNGYLAFGCRYTGGSSNGSQRRLQLLRHELKQVPTDWEPYLVSYQVKAEASSHVSGAHATQANRRSLKEFPEHLRNITVIDSVTSGTHKLSDLYFKVLLPILDAFGIPRVYVSTTGPDTIALHGRTFSSSSTVVVLGGDTSIQEFVNALQPTCDHLSLTVVAIPTGTGNALASSVGIVSPLAAISRLFVGTPVPLCSSVVNLPRGCQEITSSGLGPDISGEMVSLVVVSWGFHASLVADSDLPELRKLGIARFKKAAEINAARTQDYKGVVEYPTASGQPDQLRGPHSYVLLTAVTSLEPTFKISPLSTPPSSQQLYLVQIDTVAGEDLMEIMGKVYANAAHIADDRVRYVPIPGDASITITDPRPEYRRVCVDGRIILVPESSSITVGIPTAHLRGWRLYMIV